MHEKSINYDDTRGKILYLLKTRGGLSVDELARELEQSGVNVRRHLEALEKEDLVSVAVHKRERGRPGYVYHLTRRSNELFPQAYDDLSVDIFEQLEKRYGREAVCAVLEGRADKIIDRIKPAMEDKSFKKKVEEFSRIFNTMGYLTRIEQRSPTEMLMFVHHCPLLRVAEEYQEVCDEDCRIGRETVEAHFERECALSEGASCCRFWISEVTE